MGSGVAVPGSCCPAAVACLFCVQTVGAGLKLGVVWMFWGAEERNSGVDVILWGLSRVHVTGALGDLRAWVWCPN